MSRDRKTTQASPGDSGGQPLFSQAEWEQIVLRLKLSPRQSEVVAGIVARMTDSEIADSLRMAVRTVREHLTHVFGRLDVRDRVQLIIRVFSTFRQCDDEGRHRSN